MDEGLNLKVCFFVDVPDLRKGQLPGSHHPRHAEFFQNGCALGALIRHLGARMEIQLWKLALQIAQYAEILDNGRIQTVLIKGSQKIIEFSHLLFLQERIYCHIQFYPVKVAEIQRLDHFSRVRIFRVSSGSKPGTAHIDGIRSCIDRGHHTLERSCRRQ